MHRFVPVLLVLGALVALACGASASGRVGGVTVEPLATATETPGRVVATGGKPAAPPPTATAEPSPAAQADDPAAPTAEPSATPVPATPASRPTEGRWIEVDVTSFVVRLIDGDTVVREIAPVAVGAQVDTGAYLSTQTGLFYVHNKVEDLVYDAPFSTYISHWVGFDPEKDNGFHSFLRDASGAVVDASTGRVSNGCIRTGEPEAVFDFAEIGMPVWVHG